METLSKWEQLLGQMGRDEGGNGHQGDCQDESQGEVDEGGAAQQHGQVQQSHQLQHLPALLCALSHQEPGKMDRSECRQSSLF